MGSLKKFGLWAVCFYVFLIAGKCDGRTLFETEDEDSVVSIYTTLPPTMKTPAPLDIYQQIANNVAEKLTSPIFRFLGINRNKSTTSSPTKSTYQNLELIDDASEETTKPTAFPMNNNIDNERDVEELSVEALRKIDNKKPEKITLFSSYLPIKRSDDQAVNDNSKAELVEGTNATSTNTTKPNIVPVDDDDDDDDFGFDNAGFDDQDKNFGSGGFIFFLELIGSFFTLAWGAIMTIFRPSSS